MVKTIEKPYLFQVMHRYTAGGKKNHFLPKRGKQIFVELIHFQVKMSENVALTSLLQKGLPRGPGSFHERSTGWNKQHCKQNIWLSVEPAQAKSSLPASSFLLCPNWDRSSTLHWLVNCQEPGFAPTDPRRPVSPQELWNLCKHCQLPRAISFNPAACYTPPQSVKHEIGFTA